MEVLVLGAESSGKTLLVRRLLELSRLLNTSNLPVVPTSFTVPSPSLLISSSNSDGVDTIELNYDLTRDIFEQDGYAHDLSTIPTVGVELSTLALSSSSSVKLREIGSVMASKYDAYIPYCRGIIFLVDTSDFGSLASATILLHEILGQDVSMTGKAVAIVFSKLDLADEIVLYEVKRRLRLDDLKNLMASYSIPLTFYSGSCSDFKMASEIFTWISTLSSHSSS